MPVSFEVIQSALDIITQFRRPDSVIISRVKDMSKAGGETRRRKHTCIKNAYFFKNSLINFTSNSYHSKALFLFYNMVNNENKPPRKELTDAQRNRIIGAYECGVKGSAIVEQLGLPPSTAYDTIKRYNKTGSPYPQ